MDVLGLLWYVFFFSFLFGFSAFSVVYFAFFFFGGVGFGMRERERGEGWGVRGGWIDGGREEGENEREVGWKRGFFG